MDKETPVEGQEDVIETTDSPEAPEAPESSPETDSPTDEVDKELSEWAANKGLSDEDLQNPAALKAAKMAFNAEKMIGKPTQTAEEPASDDDVDIDKLLDEMLGANPTPEQKQNTLDTLEGIDETKLPESERENLKILKSIISSAVEARLQPYEAKLRQETYKTELKNLTSEFGPDVLKQAPAILQKVKSGTPLRDAAISVLMESRLKAERASSIQKGKEIKTDEIKQKVEQPKKAGTNLSTDEFDKLPLQEQEKILRDLAKK